MLLRYIALLLFFETPVLAQEHIFDNNKISDGIPSLECYNVHQDRRGYIWFSTETGLCRYNGKSIIIYNEKKGFREKTCYGICESPDGKLWFIASGNRILYYNQDKDSLCEAAFNMPLKKMLQGHYTEQFYLIKVDSSGNIILCSQWLTFVVNPVTNKIRKLSGNEFVYYFMEENGVFFPVKYNALNLKINYKQNDTITLGIINRDTSFYKLKWGKKNTFPQWRCLTIMNRNGDRFIGWDNKLIKISRNGELTIFNVETNVLSLYVDKEDDLWAGTLKNGVFHFRNSVLEHPVRSLSQISVTGIAEDNEKGIWCSTLEYGIYYCKDKRIVSYANLYEKNKTEQLFKPIDDKLYCYASNSMLYVISPNEIKSYPFSIQGGFGISDLVRYKNGFLVTNQENVLLTDSLFHKGVQIQEKETNYILGASKIDVSADGSVFLLQKASFLELNTVTNKIQRRIPDLKTNAMCMLVRPDEIFLGCRDGLYKTAVDSFHVVKVQQIEGAVTKLISTEDGNIYMCVKEKGIYSFKNNAVTNIISSSVSDGIQFFDMCFDQSGILWVATNVGLLKVNSSVPDSIKIYNSDNGLPANQVYKVTCVNENIFFTTPEGLCSFPYREDLSNFSSPEIYLENIYVNQSAIAKTDHVILNYNYSSLSVEVSALTFKNTHGPKIFYRLFYDNGKKLTSDTTVSGLIQLNNLAPNNYKLAVYAINNSNVISENPVILNFIVRKPFWQTIWFYSLSLILLIGIIYLIINFIAGRIKSKEEEKTRINKLIAEYQLSALQAQMNPHFVFNAINSIQGYILNKDEQQAYDYLAKFSKLIRMVLNYSMEKTVVLRNELEMLELYIELEQLRFDNSFTFQLQLDESVNPNVFQIPTLLIQPYIENAIWHGLMNLPGSEKGVLKLTVSYDEEYLLVTVEDNGIGREAAKLYSVNSHHHSVGMKLTEQRIMMINQMQDYEKAKVKVSDLFDHNGIACGTKVEITIPVTE